MIYQIPCRDYKVILFLNENGRKSSGFATFRFFPSSDDMTKIQYITFLFIFVRAIFGICNILKLYFVYNEMHNDFWQRYQLLKWHTHTHKQCRQRVSPIASQLSIYRTSKCKFRIQSEFCLQLSYSENFCFSKIFLRKVFGKVVHTSSTDVKAHYYKQTAIECLWDFLKYIIHIYLSKGTFLLRYIYVL